jgi:hypothetical protein
MPKLLRETRFALCTAALSGHVGVWMDEAEREHDEKDGRRAQQKKRVTVGDYYQL